LLQKWLSDCRLFCDELSRAAQVAKKSSEQFLKLLDDIESLPHVHLWKSVVKGDDKALKAFISSESVKRKIGREVNRINRSLGLDGHRKLTEPQGQTLAYLAIMDARRYYRNASKAKKYGENLPVAVWINRLPEFFRRAFEFRLTGKIGEDLQAGRGLDPCRPYVHHETGKAYLFLKDAAKLLGVKVGKLRNQIRAGVIPADCHCRIEELEGLGYYHRRIRMRVSAIMIPADQLTRIKGIIKKHESPTFQIGHQTYIPLTSAAKLEADKRGILLSSAKKRLRRNVAAFGGTLHNGKLVFPLKRFRSR